MEKSVQYLNKNWLASYQDCFSRGILGGSLIYFRGQSLGMALVGKELASSLYRLVPTYPNRSRVEVEYVFYLI